MRPGSSPPDAPVGFQLCYDKSSREHALTWTEERGREEFRREAGAVPAEIVRMVEAKLGQLVEPCPGEPPT